MGMLERTRTRMWMRWASALVGLCVGAACCAGLMAGCALSGPSVDPEDQVANWAPDPSNYDFHLLLDDAWEHGDSLTYASGEPFAVPNDETGIAFVGIEDGIARFRANLTCEGGDPWELYFAWGDVPDVGFVDAGMPFDGVSSAEQTAFGQPYFPASTMTVFRCLVFDDLEPGPVQLDLLARVPDEALEGDVAQQAAAAARRFEQTALTVDGTFKSGGMTSTSYRLALAEDFEDEVRAQVAGEATGAPLFTMQRLAYDEIPDVAWPNCWSALMREQSEGQRASRNAALPA